jgi:hypothetical protein
MSVPIDRSATLLVRVWLEEDDSFRARLTAVSPTSGPAAEEEVGTAASPDQVLAEVAAWLDAVVHRPERGAEDS